MVDSHVHLQAFEDVGAVLERARGRGVSKFIVPGDTLESSKRALEIASIHQGVHPAVGVHPHEAERVDGAVLQELKRLALSGGIIAVGEIGLDYHYDHSPREAQRKAFAQQLELADELGLPVIVHNRESAKDLLEILRSSRIGGEVVLHCFSGDREFAEEVLSLGCNLSFAGTVTFKNAGPLREVAAIVPDDRLLVETDAPYLTPHPFRGRRNEPSYLPFVVETIAQLRSTEVSDLLKIVRINVARIFGV